jgi:uncharacterized repeat protein (TIGR03803 family)
MKPQAFPRTPTRTLALIALTVLFASIAFATTPKESVLYRFKGGTDGAIPAAGLIEDAAHNLYGTTLDGGTSNLGTIFEISPPGTVWTEAVLYSFKGGTDGANPLNGNLVADKAGNLYGTTFAGGGSTNCNGTTPGCGTVFQLMPPATQGAPWTETVLYSFTGLTDGANPDAGLIMDSKGNLYGTTVYGGGVACGTTTCGTIFELTPPSTQGGPWTETVLHAFGKDGDGANPTAGLTFGLRGAIFGTTSSGNNKAKNGIVFKLKPPTTQGGLWTEGVLYRFTGGTDGGTPNAALVVDKTGNLFGTTLAGGQSYGVIFEITFGTWTQSVLYTFTGGSDGANPAAGLLKDKAGNLYGTTTFGGQNKNGSAFELSPPIAQGDPWTETTLYDFQGGHDGSAPNAALVFGKGGQLYGTTLLGGAPKDGTVFRITH